MAKNVRVGQYVRWNSESGISYGRVMKVRRSKFQLTGKDGTKYTRHATPERPVAEILSLKSDHRAYHYFPALRVIPYKDIPAEWRNRKKK